MMSLPAAAPPMKESRDLAIEDIVYCARPTGPLLCRLYRPAVPGAYPGVVSVHGGRWTDNDRLTNAVLDSAVARAGFVVMAVDFRMPPVASYPASLRDIVTAIRWLKRNGAAFGALQGRVFGLGTSSGGHQIVLAALRHADPLFGEGETFGIEDARLEAVAAGWAVLDPLRRFHMALEKQMAKHIDAHQRYWLTEAAMERGSPQGVLDRGEQMDLPPMLLVHGEADKIVPIAMAKRFAASYGQRGGRVELRSYPEAGHTFITREPKSTAAQAAARAIVDFFSHIKVETCGHA